MPTSSHFKVDERIVGIGERRFDRQSDSFEDITGAIADSVNFTADELRSSLLRWYIGATGVASDQ
jgi:hypothetical protein